MIPCSKNEAIFFLKKNIASITALPILLLFFTSCATNKNFAEIDSSVTAGNFDIAQIQLEQQKEMLYTNKDLVLYELDAGMISHFNGDYTASNTNLSKAEKLIESYFAISITQTLSSYILNDTIIDYAGEDFEDIYTNIFMALNYIQLGETEAAFVEIRRFNNKLRLLSTKYDSALQQARNLVSQEGYDTALFSGADSIDVLEFYDSALARYVSLLLYRSIGQMDSAEIDKKFIETAFLTQPQMYPFPIPNAVYEEFSIPNNKERLNVFAYTGRAPEKNEEAITIPGVINDSWFKLALPIMQRNASVISSIQITATDQNQNTFSEIMQPLESIENIAIDTFQQKQGLIYLKSLLRSISKTAVNEGVTSAMEQTDAAQWATLFNLAANVFTDLSEQADTRASRYFPATVWVGGLNLDKGVYTTDVICYDTFGKIIYHQKNENVIVDSNNVNLVEAVCLQ